MSIPVWMRDRANPVAAVNQDAHDSNNNSSIMRNNESPMRRDGRRLLVVETSTDKVKWENDSERQVGSSLSSSSFHYPRSSPFDAIYTALAGSDNNGSMSKSLLTMSPAAPVSTMREQRINSRDSLQTTSSTSSCSNLLFLLVKAALPVTVAH